MESYPNYKSLSSNNFYEEPHRILQSSLPPLTTPSVGNAPPAANVKPRWRERLIGRTRKLSKRNQLTRKRR